MSIRKTVGLILVLACMPGITLLSDEPDSPVPAAFRPSEEVSAIVKPLFDSIRGAERSRSTVKLFTEKVQDGQIIESNSATYQIASAAPDRYTVYYKIEAAGEAEPRQRTRLYNNGDKSVVAMAPDAFIPLDKTPNCQEIVTNLPVEMGPYPEPMLALTLAGVDPSFSLLTGMKSVDVIERKSFRGRVASIRLRGLQNDGVVWDLWISDEAKPQPLRLIVDLTPVLIATKKVNVPEGYAYSLRYDFISWRVTGAVDDSLFEYEPPATAKKFDTLGDYQRSLAGPDAETILGQPSPEFTLELLDGSTLNSNQLQGKTIVLDFWSTTCGPCIAGMPTLIETTKSFADKDVVFIAVNIGESASRARGFLSVMDWDVRVAIDPEQTVAKAFEVKTIPRTILISPMGIIEAIHVGKTTPAAMTRSLTDELDVLVRGGRIASAETE